MQRRCVVDVIIVLISVTIKTLKRSGDRCLHIDFASFFFFEFCFFFRRKGVCLPLIWKEKKFSRVENLLWLNLIVIWLIRICAIVFGREYYAFDERTATIRKWFRLIVLCVCGLWRVSSSENDSNFGCACVSREIERKGEQCNGWINFVDMNCGRTYLHLNWVCCCLALIMCVRTFVYVCVRRKQKNVYFLSMREYESPLRRDLLL